MFRKNRSGKAALGVGCAEEMNDVFDFVLANLGQGESYAQLRQDVFALIVNGFKRDGFFVEFGATDGVELSNTALLERDYGWSGIVSEPNPDWHAALFENRGCHIDKRCVWTQSGQTLEFLAAEQGVFSTLTNSKTLSPYRKRLRDTRTIMVETISLMDLLAAHNAPDTIDFLSIDTEGSELSILSSFDFSRYSFNAIVVEHNFMPIREGLKALLEEVGYKRVFRFASKWDDWYVRQDAAFPV